MEAWMNVVSVAMSDKILDQIVNKPVTNSDDATLQCNKSKPKLVEQNETWIQETAFKLNILINELTDVFINCSKSLSFSSGKLLDILVTLTDHEIQPVSKRSRHLLKRVIQTFPFPLIFIEMVEDNLYGLVSKLPRIVHNSDDSKILSSLSLLAQYLRILGHKVDRLVGSHVHLKRLASSLLQLAEMDCSDVNVVALKTSIVDFSEKFDKENVAGSKQRLQKVFKYFLNQKIYEEFEKICCLLGCYSNIEHLTDHFLDIFMTTSRHRKEAALIMNKLLLGASGKTSPNSDDDDLSNLIAAVDQNNLTLQTRNKTKL